MVDGWGESKLWWREGEIVWEPHLGFEVATVVDGVLIQYHDADIPDENIRIVFQFYIERGNSLFRVG